MLPVGLVSEIARGRGRQLAEIRRQGHAVTTGEYEEPLRAVAAPVVEPGGIWGLSVVGPVVRMRDERCRSWCVLWSARLGL